MNKPVTKLAAWMLVNDKSDEALAAELGVSRVHVSRLRRGLHRPRHELALKLEKVTNLPASTFIFDEGIAA